MKKIENRKCGYDAKNIPGDLAGIANGVKITAKEIEDHEALTKPAMN